MLIYTLLNQIFYFQNSKKSVKMYCVRGEEEDSSSDIDLSSEISESETTEVNDDSSSDDDHGNLDAGYAAIEVPAGRIQKSSDDDDSEKEVDRSRSRSPLQRMLNHGDNIEVSDNNNERAVQKDQSLRDKEIRRNEKIVNKPVGFEWVKPKRPTKSEVWNQFGFKKFPNKKTNFNKVYCKLCGDCKNYAGTTTNMKHHSVSKHAINCGNNDDVPQPKATHIFSMETTP